MTEAVIPLAPLTIGVDEVKTARPVRAHTWQSLSSLHNWIKGRGSTLVPFYTPKINWDTGASVHTFKFRVAQHRQTIRRMWCITARAYDGEEGTIEARAPAGSGTYSEFNVSPGVLNDASFVIFEDITTQGASNREIDLDIRVAANILVTGIACFGMPRSVMDSDVTNDRPQPLSHYGYGQPISEPIFLTDDVGESGLGRKTSLIQWAVPSEVDGGSTDAFAYSNGTTGFTDVWILPIPILGAKTSGTTTTVQVRCLARVTSGTGTIRYTTNPGGTPTTVDRTLTNTSYSWVTADTLTIDAEDMDSTDGRQTSATPAWDTLQVSGKHNTGGDPPTLYIAAVSVYVT